jgi:anti-sigma B factor antagonist
MDLEIEQLDDATLITVLERAFDTLFAERFKAAAAQVAAAGGRRLIVDLRAVTMLDSSGLGALISAYRTMDGRVAVVLNPANRTVREVLRLTRIDRLLSVHDSIEDAVRAPA